MGEVRERRQHVVIVVVTLWYVVRACTNKLKRNRTTFEPKNYFDFCGFVGRETFVEWTHCFVCLFYFRLFDVHSFHSAEAHVRFVRIAHATHTHPKRMMILLLLFILVEWEFIHGKIRWFGVVSCHVQWSRHDTHRQIHSDWPWVN